MVNQGWEFIFKYKKLHFFIRGYKNFVCELSRIYKAPKKTFGKPEIAIKNLIQKQLRSYLDGKSRQLSFSVDPAGTIFQRQVWKSLQTVKYGKTISYQDLAKMAGRPKAIRAAASAVAANPILLAIPCHRIIRSNGDLGGFSAGLDLKKELLLLENKKFVVK